MEIILYRKRDHKELKEYNNLYECAKLSSISAEGG